MLDDYKHLYLGNTTGTAPVQTLRVSWQIIFSYLANLEILIPPASGVHALDEGDVVGLVEDEGAIWAHRAVSGHHLWKIKHSVSVISRILE